MRSALSYMARAGGLRVEQSKPSICFLVLQICSSTPVRALGLQDSVNELQTAM